MAIKVELPNGQWWDLKDRLTYGAQKKFLKAEGALATDILLVEQTVAWSFPEAPSIQSINERDWRDVQAVMERLMEAYGLRTAAQTEALKKD